METNIQYLMPLIINVARYFIFAGIPFLIFYLLFPEKFSRSKIQSRFAKRKDFLREILHSVQTTLILAGVAILFLYTPLRNYTLIYDQLNDFSIWWVPVSVFLALVVHDTYFYWMHRAVHHPRLFKHIHLVHHRSVNPSPWASYSFHFLEGCLEAMIAPILFILIPMHPLAIASFAMVSFIINVYGHLGYEIAPKWFRNTFLFSILNTSTHHNLHHEKFKGNYGLYFRVWDRLMGTEHPNYVKEYDKIQERRFGTNLSSPSLSKNFFVFAFLIFGVGMYSANAQSNIQGKWKDNKEGGIILIYEEGGKFFGQLIGAEKPEENEKIKSYDKIIMMKDFIAKSDTEFCCGTIYQPKEKRLISASLELKDAKTLKINGRYGPFTGTRTWTKLCDKYPLPFVSVLKNK